MASRQQTVDQSAPLLGALPRREHAVPGPIPRRLCTSHFLSTWNSRVFEFGSVLYLAAIYPGTCCPCPRTSWRGVFLPSFRSRCGTVHRSGEPSAGGEAVHRLVVPVPAPVKSSLLTNLVTVLQRLAVVVSCVIFYALTVRKPSGPGGDAGMLALLSAFACLEKLGSIMNLVSVEKDWVRTSTRCTIPFRMADGAGSPGRGRC